MTETKQIYAALVRAQSKMKHAQKNVSNTFFKAKYSNLDSIDDAISGPFAENGLGKRHDVISTIEGVSVRCVIFHESGESLVGEWLFLPVKDKTAQAFGSAVTYGRRYTLAAHAGVITGDDDDGNAASSVSVKQTNVTKVNKTKAGEPEDKSFREFVRFSENITAASSGEELLAVATQLKAAVDLTPADVSDLRLQYKQKELSFK